MQLLTNVRRTDDKNQIFIVCLYLTMFFRAEKKMDLIKLKNDSVINVSPIYSETETETTYNEDYVIYGSFEKEFKLTIDFDKENSFKYVLKNDYIDEDIVSSVINFLFLDKDKFSAITTDEFKVQLRKYLDNY